ncbi:MAG: glycosyltransferase family 4 protein [bacterium]|nr:glycosyltransferase family 4 protein [bacterium]MDA1024643.1 glycosyltransferase family 4 protein [bacterium]
MKIGIVTNLYPPYVRGGAEQIVARTVNALQEIGQDVFVITAQPHWRRRGKKEMNLELSVERVYRFIPKNLYFVLDDHRHTLPVRLLWHIIDTLGMYPGRRVRSILEEERPDIVITHNLKGIGLSIPRAIHRAGIPHIHIAHDLQLIYPSGLLIAGKEKKSFWLRPIYALYRAITKERFSGTDVMVSPSQYLKSVYETHGIFEGAVHEVVPNPTPLFTPRSREHRPDGALRLFFAGQLEYHKGIELLIDAVQSIDIPIELMIAGEGTYREYVKKLAAKYAHINYLGFVSMDQIVSCLGLVDAVIVPSLCYENSPTIIYESFMAGVPVIAADIGGVGELVNNEDNGLLFTPGDKTDLMRVLRSMDEQKVEYFARQRRIQETVVNYSLDRYLDRLMGILESQRQKS